MLCYRGLLLGFNHVAFAVTSAKKLVYLNVRPFAPANCGILRSQISLYIAGGGQEPLRVAPLLTSLDCALRIVCMRSLLPLHFNGARRLPALHRGLPVTYMHAWLSGAEYLHFDADRPELKFMAKPRQPGHSRPTDLHRGEPQGVCPPGGAVDGGVPKNTETFGELYGIWVCLPT